MGKPGPKRERLAPLAPAAPADFSQFDLANPEKSFAQFTSAARRKRLGQFFTPRPIAELMASWALVNEPATMLDPAAGPGMFVRCAAKLRPRLKVTAIDVDSLALDCLSRALPSGSVLRLHTDFLTWPSEEKFDAILANPPYLRHHDLNYAGDIVAEIGAKSGVALSRLTNAYGLFLLEICRRLQPGGRAAVIVPGEWLNANFGEPLKQFLLGEGLLTALVYFSGQLELFDDALTTACLLFLEKPSAGGAPPRSVRTIYVRQPNRLEAIAEALVGGEAADASIVVRDWRPGELPAREKWNALLEKGELLIPDGFVRLGELALSRRGIATGANRFFHLSQETIEEWRLPAASCRPCVGRAGDVRGYVFAKSDLAELDAAGRRSRLLICGDRLTAPERRYFREGERQGLPRRYLLAQRSPWYAMESRPPAPIWAAVFGRGGLRFIYNRAMAFNLTTFHCLYPFDRRPRFHQALAACLNSPLVQTLAHSRQRVYGGGLLKYEPRDLLEIPVPDLRKATPETIRALGEALKELDNRGRSLRQSHAVLEDLDALVLQAASGETEAANGPPMLS